MSKQYIQWYDTEVDAWQFVLEHIKILRATNSIKTHALGVEFYKGKWWIVLKRK